MPSLVVAQPEPSSSDSLDSVPSTAHFAVHAVADAAALSRVVEFFALNNILPETVRARRYVDGDLVVDVKVRGLDDRNVAVIANKLRACVLVYGVTVEVVAVGCDQEDYRFAQTSDAA